MSGKKIIVVSTELVNGGAERVLSELIPAWISAGHRVTLIQTDLGIYDCGYKLPKECEMLYIRTNSKSRIITYLIQLRELRKIIKRQKNANIIAFIYGSIFISTICSLFTNNRVIVSERCNPWKTPPGIIKKKLRNLSFRLSDVCVFQTNEARNYFSKRVQRKGLIIPNPINPSLPDRYEGERKKLMVAACRMTAPKNLPMMIMAFKKFSLEHSDYILKIYGRGELEEEIRTLIIREGMEKKILLPGFSADIYLVVREATAYVSSSDFEGISNSMLEALAMGVPSIVTDCPVGGARLVIKNMENGILVPVGDVEAMYQAMKLVVEDTELSERLSINSTKIRQKYSVDKISRKWLELLQ